MKINIYKDDICHTCKYGKQTRCEADYDNVFIDDVGNISECKCYKAKTKDQKKQESARFVPPTVVQIAEYVNEMGYEDTDPQAFFDYYDGVGWLVGKSLKPMKNWKAGVRQWNSRQIKWKNEEKVKENKSRLSSSPTYDIDEIEKNALTNTDIV